MMTSQKDAATTVDKSACSSPVPKSRTAEMPGAGSVRLPATPQTTGGGKPRDAAGPVAKKSEEESSSRLEKLYANAQQGTEEAAAELLIWLQTANRRFLGFLEKVAEPKTAKAFRARCQELRQKMTTKAIELGGSAKAQAAALAARAKGQARMPSQTASAHLADWLEEQVRQVGWWAHPGPVALFFALALLILFLGCSLGSTWPVRVAPAQHPAGTSGGDSGAVALGFAAQEPLEPTISQKKEGPVLSIDPIVLPEPVRSQEDEVAPQGASPSSFRYGWNTQRYSDAKRALQAHDFDRAHQILTDLSDEGGALDPRMHWESFGNFSRAGFLADFGTTLVSAGQYAPAVALLAEGLPGVPAPAAALNALGIAYRNLGDYHSALGAFQTAANFAPRNAMAWNNLGVVAMEVGKLQQADDAFYYAAEAYGPGAEEHETLVTNVQVLRDRALGRPQQQVTALELWYDEE